jgi:putative glycosyltransferase
MKISVVTTLYRSQPYVKGFYARVCSALASLAHDYEIIFVNDGSPDDSLQHAKALADEDPSVRVVDLSRNFGHHRALMTGLKICQGDLVFMLDSDLEEPPELLGQFFETMQSTQADVVYGVQASSRKGGVLERLGGSIFYHLFNTLSDVKIPHNVLTVRLMTRRYVDALLQHGERQVVIAGLWALTGFQQVPVKVDKLSRGGTTYSFSRRFGMLVHTVASFSQKPLVWIAYLGAAILFLSSIYILNMLAVRLFFGKPPDGYASIIISIWFLGGLIIFCQGTIAIYLSIIFLETKQRPLSIIRAVYGGERLEQSSPVTAEDRDTQREAEERESERTWRSVTLDQ